MPPLCPRLSVFRETAERGWRMTLRKKGQTPPSLVDLSSHRSRSSLTRCRCTDGGSWPGSCCPLCPVRRSGSGSSSWGARWSPTRTQSRLGMSPDTPGRTGSRCWGRAHWGHSHLLQDNTHGLKKHKQTKPHQGRSSDAPHKCISKNYEALGLIRVVPETCYWGLFLDVTHCRFKDFGLKTSLPPTFVRWVKIRSVFLYLDHPNCFDHMTTTRAFKTLKTHWWKYEACSCNIW